MLVARNGRFLLRLLPLLRSFVVCACLVTAPPWLLKPARVRFPPAVAGSGVEMSLGDAPTVSRIKLHLARMSAGFWTRAVPSWLSVSFPVRAFDVPPLLLQHLLFAEGCFLPWELPPDPRTDESLSPLVAAARLFLERLGEAIADGPVFVKVGFVSPTDVKWLLPTPLCAEVPEDVLKLVFASTAVRRVTRYLCLDDSAHLALATPYPSLQLILKPFVAFPESAVFRVFVRSGQIVAISQRHTHVGAAYLLQHAKVLFARLVAWTARVILPALRPADTEPDRNGSAACCDSDLPEPREAAKGRSALNVDDCLVLRRHHPPPVSAPSPPGIRPDRVFASTTFPERSFAFDAVFLDNLRDIRLLALNPWSSTVTDSCLFSWDELGAPSSPFFNAHFPAAVTDDDDDDIDSGDPHGGTGHDDDHDGDAGPAPPILAPPDASVVPERPSLPPGYIELRILERAPPIQPAPDLASYYPRELLPYLAQVVHERQRMGVEATARGEPVPPEARAPPTADDVILKFHDTHPEHRDAHRRAEAAARQARPPPGPV